MSEMVERVARALCSAYGFDPTQTVYAGQTVEEVQRGEARIPVSVKWKEYKPFARAAIKAMREPTDAMLTAEGTEVTGGRGTIDGYLDYWNADGVWKAMIDEALK